MCIDGFLVRSMLQILVLGSLSLVPIMTEFRVVSLSAQPSERQPLPETFSSILADSQASTARALSPTAPLPSKVLKNPASSIGHGTRGHALDLCEQQQMVVPNFKMTKGEARRKIAAPTQEARMQKRSSFVEMVPDVPRFEGQTFSNSERFGQKQQEITYSE